MYKVSAALALTGFVGLAFASAHGSKPIASNDVTQAQATPTASESATQEHVRHLHARRKIESSADTALQGQAPQSREDQKRDTRLKSASVIDAAPTGEIKHTRKKTKPIARKMQREIASEQDAFSQPVAAAETQIAKPKGFFEALFSAN